MTRSNAREIVSHLIFEMNFTTDPASQLVDAAMEPAYYESLAQETEIYAERPSESQMAYIRSAVQGIQEKQEELDGYIEKFSNNWKLSRISLISRSVMEVAMYEILYVDDVPAGVAINEAVELCKKYEEAETVSFVNGILGKFAKEVAADVSGN